MSMDDKRLRYFDEAADRASKAHDYMVGLMFAVPMVATTLAVAVRRAWDQEELSETERIAFIKKEVIRDADSMKTSMPYASQAVDDFTAAIISVLNPKG